MNLPFTYINTHNKYHFYKKPIATLLYTPLYLEKSAIKPNKSHKLVDTLPNVPRVQFIDTGFPSDCRDKVSQPIAPSPQLNLSKSMTRHKKHQSTVALIRQMESGLSRRICIHYYLLNKTLAEMADCFGIGIHRMEQAWILALEEIGQIARASHEDGKEVQS